MREEFIDVINFHYSNDVTKHRIRIYICFILIMVSIKSTLMVEKIVKFFIKKKPKYEKKKQSLEIRENYV